MNQFIFIGYRGTGKTTIARRLGERLGIVPMDSDTEIERQVGKNITEIFSLHGEMAFRDWEETIIAEMLEQNKSKPFILATGGGAILRETTRARLKNAGHVIWLTAEPETILQRIQSDTASETMRPNLTSLPPQEEIISVLKNRESFYKETAHQIIATDSISIEAIIDEILKR